MKGTFRDSWIKLQRMADKKGWKTESVNEGQRAFLAYRTMKEGIEDTIKGIRILRGHIDNAPYNKKFSLMTSELYKFQIDMEKKLHKFIPQISKLSKDKMLESWSTGLERYKVTLENGEDIDVKVKEGKGLDGLEELLKKEGLKFEKIIKKASRPTLTSESENEAEKEKSKKDKEMERKAKEQAKKDMEDEFDFDLDESVNEDKYEVYRTIKNQGATHLLKTLKIVQQNNFKLPKKVKPKMNTVSGIIGKDLPVFAYDVVKVLKKKDQNDPRLYHSLWLIDYLGSTDPKWTPTGKVESVNEDIGIDTYLGGIVKAMRNAGIKPKTAKQMKSGFSVSKNKIGFFIDVEQRGFDKIEKYTLQIEVDKKGDLWYLSGNRPLHMGPWANTNRVTRMFRMLNKIRGFGQTKFGKI
jgi:hypothetical protein